LSQLKLAVVDTKSTRVSSYTGRVNTGIFKLEIDQNTTPEGLRETIEEIRTTSNGEAEKPVETRGTEQGPHYGPSCNLGWPDGIPAPVFHSNFKFPESGSKELGIISKNFAQYLAQKTVENSHSLAKTPETVEKDEENDNEL